jgi:surface antigen
MGWLFGNRGNKTTTTNSSMAATIARMSKTQKQARMAQLFAQAEALQGWMNSGEATPAEYKRDARDLAALAAEYDAIEASL